MIDSVVVTLIGLLQCCTGLVILELIKNTECIVIRETTTCSQNIVGCVVQDNLLGVINTLGTAHVLDILSIHVGEC